MNRKCTLLNHDPCIDFASADGEPPSFHSRRSCLMKGKGGVLIECLVFDCEEQRNKGTH